MRIKFLDNEIAWENFLNNFSEADFLHSFEWGKINKPARYLAVINDNGQALAAAILLEKRALIWKYFYSPRSPLFVNDITAEQKKDCLVFLSDFLSINYKNCLFWRLEPDIDLNDLKKCALDDFVKTIDLQPAKTLYLDLRFSENNLLEAMHSKTRYNIRLSEKKNLIVREAKRDEFDEFWKLMKETGSRDAFGVHSKNHYQKILDSSNGKFKLYVAIWNHKIIAAGIFSFVGKTVTYLHGASSSANRNLMAPYALHWFLIRLAKKLGFLRYDFYGIDEHKWPGVTRFKNGFGGIIKEYAGTFDFVINSGYYNLYKKLRAIRRKF
ncbi:MAG: peptidoglycan bridge formation glycyltransferase FemA/FemB family protein [Patescibacteria group bacterium]|nr:peptidoglycan bridge formation glycyltransferase FemA/FemB family protein [Patescibacteria group bacterium]